MTTLNFSTTVGITEQKTFLSSGIVKAKFKGITKEVVKDEFNTLCMTFDIEGFGEFKHRLFAPTSNERSTTIYGENPSQVEQFLIACRHLLDTINPDISKGIEDGSIVISGNFDQIIKQLQGYSKDAIGMELELKLLPNKSGYPNLPQYCARISKKGQLYLSTRFIGHDLTLTPYEVEQIDKAKNAVPTNMNEQAAASTTADMLADYEDVKVDDNSDDLPF